VTNAADISRKGAVRAIISRREIADLRAGKNAGGKNSQETRGRNRSPPRLRSSPPRHDRIVSLTDLHAEQWQNLAERVLEPNGYYLPGWELAVNASSPGRGDGLALTAWGSIDGSASATRLIGLMPAVSAWRAYRIPLSALVSADPYGTLGTPLLDTAAADEAVRRMIRQARDARMRALILRDIPLEGPVLTAFRHVLGEMNLAPRILQSRMRASLDATGDADVILHDALGSKKLKELRRQRNRLAEHGVVTFHVAREQADIARALEAFLALEASGWKGRSGTAMMQTDGDAAFMRRAMAAMSTQGQCEIVALKAGMTTVASGVVLRHRDRAFWFKLGIDERFAKMSPGVQLALDLTRHLCADPQIAFADSTADSDHPMIDPIWRGRLMIGDVMVPLKPEDPVAATIHAAIVLRRLAREPARQIVHAIRAVEKRRQ
jgi:hypothetical protein